jgi:DNA-binding CsgD family transcriptional regulator
MGLDRISSLTDSQRAYLRLVLEHRTSKEIALHFGISAHTVDKRIKEAMRILHARSRVEAAQMLAAAESGGRPPLGPQSPDLGIPAFSADETPLGITGTDGGKQDVGHRMGEEQVAYRALPVGRGLPLPFPTQERPRNTLTILQRLGWTVGLIIGLAIATGMMLSGISALGSLVVEIAH